MAATDRSGIEAKTRALNTLLKGIAEDSELSGCVALHGGSAINGFLFDPPRLSVDLDLSFTGDCAVDELPRMRDKLIEGISEIGREEGFEVTASKPEHAGRTLRFHRRSFEVKADVSFMNRVTVDEPELRRSKLDPSTNFPILSPYDLIGGKVRASLERVKSRDLYDLMTIRGHLSEFDDAILHGACLLYASLSDGFPQRYATGEFSSVFALRLEAISKDVAIALAPMLAPESEVPSAEKLISTAQKFMREVVEPRTSDDAEYLVRMSRGDYRPELILPARQAARAKRFPSAIWKAKNLAKRAESARA